MGKMGKGLGRILFEVALVGLVEKYSSKFPQFLRGMIAACFNRWPFGVSRNSEFVHNFTDCFLLLQNFIYTPNISRSFLPYEIHQPLVGPKRYDLTYFTYRWLRLVKRAIISPGYPDQMVGLMQS